MQLRREVTLLEYGTCSDSDEAAVLFDRRLSLQPYLTQRWLTRFFDEDQPCLRASHYVGLLPFRDEDGPHLLLIAPKGCRQDPGLGLLRFLELLALGEGISPPEGLPGLQGELGARPFLLFLAAHYGRLLRELCRLDFRSYYRAEAGELRSHIRGRLHLAGYMRRALQGKRHVLPCRWDEFTVDNWDNRILWAAARRLKQVAAALDPQAAAAVWQPFQQLLSWFSAVAEMPLTAADLGKSRLGRTSRYYRHALAWAQLLIRGSDLPGTGGDVPPLVLSAQEAFEKFAEVVARAALPNAAWQAAFQQSWLFLTGTQDQSHKPDILLSGPRGVRAVGDAKYKEVLDRAAGAWLEAGEEVSKVCLQAADWNQLYVYMRMKQASCGFFVVPFWNAAGLPFEWFDHCRFAVPPCDGKVRVAVLALNLLQPLKEVKQKAADKLRDWLSAPIADGYAPCGEN